MSPSNSSTAIFYRNVGNRSSRSTTDWWWSIQKCRERDYRTRSQPKLKYWLHRGYRGRENKSIGVLLKERYKTIDSTPQDRKNHSTPLALWPSPVFYFYTTLASNSLILKLLSCPMITSHVPIGIRLTLVFDIPIMELHVFPFNLLEESKLTSSFQSTMFQNSALCSQKITTSNPFALTSEAPKK